ncbi:MAG: septal ring lytic transglycosylase RlpA family protein [Pseudodesulfovibrio sp.]
MRHIIVLFALLAVMGMAGCSKRIYSTPPTSSSSSSGSSTQSAKLPKGFDPKTNPYTVMGERYYPLKSAAGYDEVGRASWYGKDFHGKKTANGYIYNMYGVSAAHKTLPLGTQVRVTNLENGRSVVLMINDRGPFVHGRVLDLSFGAAQKLGTVERGVAKVRITAIGSLPTAKTASKASAPTTAIKYYHVRVGAFSDRENAERTHRRLVASGYTDANIRTVNRNGRKLHIVQAGSFTSRDKAEQIMERLKPDFPGCYIMS